MKLSDMKEDIWYFVVKGTECETFKKGDHIKLEFGDLLCAEAGGWIGKDEVEHVSDFEVEELCEDDKYFRVNLVNRIGKMDKDKTKKIYDFVNSIEKEK